MQPAWIACADQATKGLDFYLQRGTKAVSRELVIMTKLKAKDPKAAEPRKPQLVIFGPAGVGKTWFALSFPSVYYIDTEGGASRSHYMDRLKASGGMYLGPEDGANDFELIISQVKALRQKIRHGALGQSFPCKFGTV